MLSDEYDVIVIGAGPGGSIAARTAAEDCDVLLIEKRQEIGAPVRCGEAVLTSAFLDLAKPEKNWISSYVRGYRIFAPNGTSLEVSAESLGIEGDLAYILERKICDRELAKNAARAGADVAVRTRATGLLMEDGAVRGVKINRLGENFEVCSKVVIGADGIESQVGRWAGIDTVLKLNDAGACAQYLMADADFAEDWCEIYFGSIATGGYAWVFPKGKGLANVGVGMAASTVKGRRPIDYLNNFVSKTFPHGQQLSLVMGGGSGSAGLKTPIANGLMLIGDAARHSDPLTGAGITIAMEGGKIAGEVARKAVKQLDASTKVLKEYEVRRRQSLWGRLQEHNYRIKEFFLTLSDHDLNQLIRVSQGLTLQNTSTMSVAIRVLMANPKILFVMNDLAHLKALADALKHK